MIPCTTAGCVASATAPRRRRRREGQEFPSLHRPRRADRRPLGQIDDLVRHTASRDGGLHIGPNRFPAPPLALCQLARVAVEHLRRIAQEGAVFVGELNAAGKTASDQVRLREATLRHLGYSAVWTRLRRITSSWVLGVRLRLVFPVGVRGCVRPPRSTRPRRAERARSARARSA
jgi:hypothetical protein